MSDPLSWQAIFAALYGAYRAGKVAYEAYSSLKKYVKRKQVEGFTPAEVEGIIRRTSKGEAIFDSGSPKTHEPGEIYRQELPVRVIEGEDIHRDRHSSSNSGMQKGSCKLPAKYFDVLGSTASGSTVTGGTTQWQSDGTLQANGNASAPGWLQLTANIAAGTGGTQRGGNAVCLKSVFVRLRFSPSSATASQEQLVRVLLVQDMNDPVPGSQIPAMSDVLMLATPATGGMESPLNISTLGRFRVINDMVLRIRSVAACGVKPEHLDHYIIHKKFSKTDKKLPSPEVLWDADGTTRGPGHLYFMLMHSENTPAAGVNVITTATSDAPGISAYVRLRFTDSI